ncbi:MAG TPA: class I SAM-dependent methyltransferase [Actinophytocola sp.]|uniref:class I SAM-dependent methyltransferase n=1 Tax=Actinophytocola sp. TaxID=1872138 RepID=UPI002DDDAD86|nr:class I SAM-dependent methyltransferase [Actinophytocola sp.]HEV2780508.1 class I SAM-dependent methyltransferase [Actinophytocola sp.]
MNQHGTWYDDVLPADRLDGLAGDPAGVPCFTALDLPDDEASLIDEKYHDGEAEIYDSYCEIPRYREAESWIVPWLDTAVPAGIVLDVGTGTGRVAAALQRPDRRLIAVDRSVEMLARARARLDPRRSVALRSDARTLPIASGSVDAAVCSGVLHHLPHWPDAVLELARTLRPGGRLVVREPNARYPEHWFAPLENLLERAFRPADRPGPTEESLSPTEYPIDPATLATVARVAGLRRVFEGSAMFLGSLALPDRMPGHRSYYAAANLVDRAVLRLRPHSRGALTLSVWSKVG